MNKTAINDVIPKNRYRNFFNIILRQIIIRIFKILEINITEKYRRVTLDCIRKIAACIENKCKIRGFFLHIKIYNHYFEKKCCFFFFCVADEKTISYCEFNERFIPKQNYKEKILQKKLKQQYGIYSKVTDAFYQ